MEKKKVVIISGKQFSGKDTVANFLKNYLKDFEITPIANAIKIQFGEDKNLTLKEIERNKPLYRANLIELGNEKRTIDKNYWINKVLSTSRNIIVSDVRLKNELEIFKKLGAISIRVEADREERSKRGKLVKEDDFTETDLDNVNNWNYLIENNGTIEELEEKVSKIVKEILNDFLRLGV